MRIVTHNTANPNCLIEAEYLQKNKRYKIFFRCKGDAILSANNEAFLASAILPCMKVGGPLIAEGQVSQKFISGLTSIQEIHCMWDTSLNRVEIKDIVPVPTTNHSTENRIATFFSGGVDSFYTLLKHQDEITDLIFVHGLDIRLNDTRLREQTSKKLNEVATDLGKNLIEIETNIREFIDPYVRWGPLGHGAALAAIGHLLYPVLQRIYIPATHTYSDLFPWGSHPVLDHFWSSESLEFIHDGCEATRLDKVSLLAKYDVALRSLRVCWQNPNSSYNCGQCEKCLRTMINLKVNNAYCTTFSKELDLKNVMEISADDESTRAFIQENLNMVKKHKIDDGLEKALEHVLNKSNLYPKIKRRCKTWIKSKIMRFS